MKHSKSKKIATIFLAASMVFPNGIMVNAEAADANQLIEKIESDYSNMEMKYRPYARWWLAEGSHTDTTLRESIKELYDAGYGGIEFVTLDESKYLDDKSYAWGSAEWIHDTKVIIQECQKYGMSVSMTSGTHWATANLTTITPDDQSASQELGYTTVSISGGENGEASSYIGKLPVCVLPEGATKQRLEKVIVAKVTDPGSEDTPAKLDTNCMVDITDSVVEENGEYNVDFIAEDSDDYMIFAFYQYGTGENYKPSVDKSYTINYMSPKGAEALIQYWDEHVLTDDVQGIIDQIEECDLYMDSLELNCRGENTTHLLWSEEMLNDFASRRNYDIGTLLPFLIKTSEHPLVNTFEPADDEMKKTIDNLRTDFYQTMTDLYQENCLDIIREWLHTKNMKLRAEVSYCKTLEISQPVKSVDYVEGESLEFFNNIDLYRGLSGAAHIFDKRYSSETGAMFGANYLYDSDYYRQIFYMQYASGIQKTVTHGYSAEYGPEGAVAWPGYEGMFSGFSERFNKRQPYAIDSEAVNGHLSRIQKVLEQGVPQMDIGMLRSDYNYNAGYAMIEQDTYQNKAHNQEGYYWNDMELQNNGYTYEYFSPYLLQDEEYMGCTNGVVNEDGVAYQALIVMEDELPYKSAEKLLEWTQEGFPVVFVNNIVEEVSAEGDLKYNTVAGSSTGTNDGLNEDLAEIVAQIKEQTSVRTVDSTADAMEALEELGVYPRAQFVDENKEILTVMRKTDDVNYLYLYDYMYQGEADYEGQISLAGNYKPYMLDTWSGKVSEVSDYEQKDGRTVIDYAIHPGDVQILVLDKTDAETAVEEAAEDASVGEADSIELTNWQLTVDSWEPGEKITRTETTEDTGLTTTEVTYGTEHVTKEVGTLEALVPWKDIESVGENVSGVGTYTNTFVLADDWNKENSKVEFHADSFEGGTASVYINGKKASVNMESCVADITDYVQPGENTITVNVTSSLRNVMRSLEYKAWYFGDPGADDYGMTGKTEINIYTK